MRGYVIAQAVAAVVQCLLVWLVVTITNRKLDRNRKLDKQWEEATISSSSKPTPGRTRRDDRDLATISPPCDRDMAAIQRWV
ncbi:MAG: hypothetical protein ACRDJV_10000 [Actinomycetota bacterium]|jgi:hypothetical protein